MELIYSLGLVLAGFFIATLRNSISSRNYSRTNPKHVLPEAQIIKKEFLDQHVFYDLNNLNTGFDVESIKYFSRSDFQKVLDRVEFFDIGIMGIEAWPDGKFHDVEVYEEYSLSATDPKWYRSAFQKLQNRGSASHFSASYWTPDDLLKLFVE